MSAGDARAPRALLSAGERGRGEEGERQTEALLSLSLLSLLAILLSLLLSLYLSRPALRCCLWKGCGKRWLSVSSVAFDAEAFSCRVCFVWLFLPCFKLPSELGMRCAARRATRLSPVLLYRIASALALCLLATQASAAENRRPPSTQPARGCSSSLCRAAMPFKLSPPS